MFCKICGKEINDNAVICPHCGCATGNQTPNVPIAPNPVDTGHIGWGFLGFFFPIIGLILYLCWKGEKPITAKVVGKGALIGVIVEAVLIILYVLFIFVIVALLASLPY